ncbi:MAG TPA: succinate dehydrogenase/fumarate reductase iron-sulfur subunit [Methanomicrobiales archaeon]|jgi:succinate dehydrogenase / fumarate reductase iron-sulfur subunit|nr:succinate dehydrogenase/fumarate reductase iron-sulfur subunit [Methanomicrobiales archaeon]
MKLKVFRSGRGMAAPRYDDFEIDPLPGMTVLSALFQAQETDDSLAFRYSCRGAVCGTCAMLINKVPGLACRTQVQALLEGKGQVTLAPYPALGVTVPWDQKNDVLVEPLPHLPVIRDLIVDMTRFFEYYRVIDPVFSPGDPDPEKERLMSPAAVKELVTYTNCILCGACFGACPVNARDPEYLGPAALAALYRFHIDPRDGKGAARLGRADTSGGWWGCEFHTNCRRVCPKGVPPNVAIGRARQELAAQGRSRDGGVIR